MKSRIEKWGKVIECSITNEASWLVVTDSPNNWIYITKRDFGDNVLTGIIKNTSVRPEFVKKKEMRDLLAHFGISKHIIQNLFKKNESIQNDV